MKEQITQEQIKRACKLCAEHNGSGCVQSGYPDSGHWMCEGWLERARSEMKASDTVMSPELQKVYGIKLPQHIAAIEFQDEISFKAGYIQAKKESEITINDLISDARKAGMKEVVKLLSSLLSSLTNGTLN